MGELLGKGNMAKNMNVFFTISDGLNPSDIQSNTIVIRQEREGKGWNDFGYKIECWCYSRTKDDRYKDIEKIFVGFIPENVDAPKAKENKFRGVTDILRDKGYRTGDLVPAEKLPFFFTLFPNLDTYRRGVRLFGVDGAKEYLLQLNDLVVNKNENESKEWYERAISSGVFKTGFMRNSESFFTYHNADSILDGIEYENLKAISEKLNLEFKLESFQNKHCIAFKFNTSKYIPSRITVLIGKNGLGKSQALNQFVRSMLRQKDYVDNLVDMSGKYKRPMINRILAIGTPGETTNTFPYRKKGQKIDYKLLTLTRKSRGKYSESIGERLAQLARNKGMIGKTSRWSLFKNSLGKVFDVDKLVIKIKKEEGIENGFWKIIDLENGYSEEHNLKILGNIDRNCEPLYLENNNFYPLSSGQLTFFKFALLCCLYIENGTYVLMDEPETHLHPNLISDFVFLLDEILENTGSLAIIATHSPYFVREVSREQVHIFKSSRVEIDEFEIGSEKNITIVSPRLKTFGADVDSISQFVFDEDIKNRLSESLLKKMANKTNEEFKDLIKNGLEQELPLNVIFQIRQARGLV